MGAGAVGMLDLVIVEAQQLQCTTIDWYRDGKPTLYWYWYTGTSSVCDAIPIHIASHWYSCAQRPLAQLTHDPSTALQDRAFADQDDSDEDVPLAKKRPAAAPAAAAAKPVAVKAEPVSPAPAPAPAAAAAAVKQEPAAKPAPAPATNGAADDSDDDIPIIQRKNK